MKTCSRCKTPKPLSEFGRSTARADKLNVYCLPCAREVSRTSAAKNPEKARVRGKKWYAENRERRLSLGKEWMLANPEKAKAIQERFKKAHPEKISEYSKKWYWNNREKALASDKASREANLEKFLEREHLSYQRHAEKRRAKSARWREKHPESVTLHAATRRSALAKRTPPWLTHEQYEHMRDIFWACRLMSEATGEKHHVDHIVPLRGKNVSGLNVPWNLQIITAVENLKKTNSHDVSA